MRVATLHTFISSRSTGQLIIAAMMANPSRARMHTLTISTAPLRQILIRFAIQFFRLAAHAFHKRFARGSLFIGAPKDSDANTLVLIKSCQLETTATVSELKICKSARNFFFKFECKFCNQSNYSCLCGFPT